MPPVGFAFETIRKFLELKANRDDFHSFQSLDDCRNRLHRVGSAWLAFGTDARSSGRQLGAISLKPRSEIADDVGQLSGRPSCQRGAGLQLGGDVLSLGASLRSEEQRVTGSRLHFIACGWRYRRGREARRPESDRESTRLNSSHVAISDAVFC